MAVDLSVFQNQKSLIDQNQLQAEFELRKQTAAQNMYALQSGMKSPAAIQIANEIQKALQAGDVGRANLLTQSAKLFDKGLNPYGQSQQPVTEAVDMNGLIQQLQQQTGSPVNYNGQASAPMPVFNPQAIPGYAGAVSSIEGAKAGAKEQAQKTVDLAMNPWIESATTFAGVNAKDTANKSIEAGERLAGLPQLEATVAELSRLGKTATYTNTGQAINAARRESGLPVGEGAVARAEYVSLIDNQILPLLRQTFGAQFTEKEGNSLKATLGDPNKSPEEKDAVLKSFIDQKKATIGTLQRDIGQTPASASQNKTIKWGDLK